MLCSWDESGPHPKPSEFMMARRRRAASTRRERYAGSSSVLKHVWLVGSLGESPPSRWITQRRLPRPPMGARSLPVKNLRKRRASSPSSSCTIAHSHCTACARTERN